MADELKIPSFSKQKKLKEPKTEIIKEPAIKKADTFVYLTEEQIESCRRGQDIFDFARDIEELVRLNNRI